MTQFTVLLLPFDSMLVQHRATSLPPPGILLSLANSSPVPGLYTSDNLLQLESNSLRFTLGGTKECKILGLQM